MKEKDLCWSACLNSLTPIKATLPLTNIKRLLKNKILTEDMSS